jgi:hypothetical protein
MEQMTIRVSTLDKLQALEAIYHDGYQNDIVDRIVDKIVLLERDQAQRDLTELQNRLHVFEAKYQMGSETFYQRFHNGTLGDGADFFEWSALYDMYQSIRGRLNVLSIG